MGRSARAARVGSLLISAAMRAALCSLIFFSLASGCGTGRPEAAPAPGPEQVPAAPREPPARRADFALAVHGGAGAPSRDLDPAKRRAYVASLAGVLRDGCAALDRGEPSLDVVERIVRALEDDPLFNAGRGAVMTRDGKHELDASIMDGRTLACGAVAAVRTVRNPISLARAVMERTPHVLLVGEGAESFAAEIGAELVPNEWFTTDPRREQLRRTREVEREDPHGTVGAVALDRTGHLAAATSTGGLSGKRWGRVGDSPIVGAGTYAADGACAVSCTGTGEEFIRHGVARAIAARMQLAGESVAQASEALVHRTLRRDDGGVIAVSHTGEVALVYNTPGMFRGSCGPGGAIDVRIWETAEELP